MLTAFSSVSASRAVIAPRCVINRTAYLALLSVAVGAILAPPVLAQTFVSQGPSPISGAAQIVQSADGPNGQTGTVTGAIQAVLPDPVNPNVIYIGATNGGVWSTQDGGKTWTPLTDKQGSLSVGALAFDPTDPSRQKLYAAMATTSSGSIGVAAPLPGILFSSNGGMSWGVIAGSTTSGESLNGKSIIAVAALGNTILAAAANDTGGGLFRSNDGGATFANITPGGSAPVTSLVSDPTRSNQLYTAVSQRGIFVSDNTGGSWTPTLTLGANQSAKLATGPGGSVMVAIYQTSGGVTSLASIQLSQDFGMTWNRITNAQSIIAGLNKVTTFDHLAIAIDKNNPNVLYVAGDFNTTEAALAASRLTVGADGTATMMPLTKSDTINSSSVHADARAFAFDASGQLLLGTDGGIYARTNPASTGGVWMGLNSSTLQTGEIYAIAYDSRSHRLLVALQDTGVGYQRAPNDVAFNAQAGADGLNAAVNDRSFADRTVIYYSVQSLGNLTRTAVDTHGNTVVDAQGNEISRTFETGKGKAGVLNFELDDFNDPATGELPFKSTIVLNKNDPTRIAFGTNYVYTTTDGLLLGSTDDNGKLLPGARPLTKRVSDINVLGGVVSAMSYGTQDNVDALLVGAPKGLFIATNATEPLRNLPNYTAAGGVQPISVVFDYNSSTRFFAVDGSKLLYSRNSGNVFENYSTNLASLKIERPTAVEFIANNGVNSLLVGGVVTDASAQSPLAAVNVNQSNGDLWGWTSFGTNLPNVLISQLSYNATADVLAIGTFGRGAWLLYDTTTWFPTATVLRFGAADNDSAPPDSILTNGIYASRTLEKVGSGTLAISGTTSYTGATNVLGGMLVANGNLMSSSGVFVGPNATLRGTGIVPSTVVSGTVAPGNSIGTLTVNGNFVQNAGSVYQVQANNAGQNAMINVSGIASVNGSVQVLAQPGTYARSTNYTILSATGGLSGTYAGVSSNFAFLRPFLRYDANDVYLTLMFGTFAAGAQTNNQYAVGSALDQAFNMPSGDFNTVLNALAGLSTAQAPAVLDAISGQPYADFGTTNLQSASLFMNAVGQQMAVARGGTGGGGTGGGQRQALAQACEIAACDATGPWGAWASALGGLGSVAANGNASSLTYNFGGGAAGLDYRLDPRFLVGFGAGYAAGNQWVNGFQGRGWTDNVNATVYGSFTQGAFYVDALAGYAYSDNRLQRQIIIPGLQPRTANGGTGANQALGQVEAGYRLGVYAPAQATVTPFGRLQAASVTQNGFSEWGANSLNLNVAQQTTNSLRSTLGADLAGAIGLGDTRKLDLALRLGWLHEYADTGRPITAAFAGAPSTAFAVYGATPQRNAAIIALSASTAIAEATSVYLRYDGEIGNGNDNHALNIGVRLTW
jgi:outer membrane autotransporter protein